MRLRRCAPRSAAMSGSCCKTASSPPPIRMPLARCSAKATTASIWPGDKGDPSGGRLEPDVLWRQAEFRAAEDQGRAFGIVAGMGAHRVHIAPGALDRVVEKEGAPAARLE